MKHQLIDIENCPICDSKKHSPFIQAVDHNVSNDKFNIVECNDCNFRFTTPIPTEETIGEYYKSEDYISHSSTKKGIINKLYHIIRERAIKQKEQLALKHSENKSILDIGCGTGDFLGYCKNNGWETLGLEPDQSARELALKNNNVEVKSLSNLYSLEENSFDVITMWHVLEHVYNLNKDIQQFKKLLKPNGTLIIAVPNCSSKDAKKYKEHWAAYDLPIHLYHFQPKNMKELFNKIDMEVVDVLPMLFDSYYISMVSEKYKNGNIISGFWNGFLSNLNANKTNNEYSSQIYIIKNK